MSKCKDCGDDWNQHVPIGFCVQSGGGFDQCGCDSIPEGTWFTEDSLAAALNETVGRLGWLRCEPPDPAAEWLMNAAAIIQAAKEGERETE